VFLVTNGHLNPPHITAAVHLTCFLLYFAEIITLLVVEIKGYYHGDLDRIDDRPLSLSDVTDSEMLVSCAYNTIGTLHTGQTDRLLGK
jgi:hypothetical protein